MANINLTSTSGSGFLETDFDQIKDVLQDGGVEAVSLTAGTIATTAGVNLDTLNTTVSNKADKNITITAISGAHTLASSDNTTILHNTGANTITLPNTLNTGFNVTVVGMDGSTITYSGTTINSKGASTTQSNQYGAVTAYYAGSSTWHLIGDLD